MGRRRRLSGTEKAPISYRAQPGESAILFSGKIIPSDSWKPLSKEASRRVHPAVKPGQLIELNYDVLGIQRGGRLSDSEQSSGGPDSFVLFVDGKRQTLARWPNHDEKVDVNNDAGWATPNGTRDDFSFYFGSGGQPTDEDFNNELDADGTHRSKRWKARLDSGNDLWVRGHWRKPWAPRLSLVDEISVPEKWIKLSQVPPGGMGSKYSKPFKAPDGKEYRRGSGAERFYALNLLEEIDRSGEYAIDFKDRRVYFYPPAKLDSLKVTISDSADPIIESRGVSHVYFDHLDFQGGLGNGLFFSNCHHVGVRGCVIDGIGRDGIVVSGGSHHLIQSNDIRETGHSGVVLTGIGNRKTLVHGKAVITNNHISHTGKLHLDTAGIRVDEVIGLTFSHNLIHHTPSRGYEHRRDNDVLFEYNEIHNCALETSDTGATYTHGKWATYGNVFRYNFIHHNKRANGFYCDDGDSGDVHYHNIIHQCIDALKFGGGHDNIARNNLLIQNGQQRIDDRGISRNYRLGTRYESDLRAFKPFEEPWKSYGLRLQKDHQLTTKLWADVFDPKWVPEHPHGCRYVDNVTVESSNWRRPKNGRITISGNEELGSVSAAGFRDFAGMDLRTENEVILSKFPTLNQVFPKIGLRTDAFRKSVPNRRGLGGLKNYGETVKGEEDADLDR